MKETTFLDLDDKRQRYLVSMLQMHGRLIQIVADKLEVTPNSVIEVLSATVTAEVREYTASDLANFLSSSVEQVIKENT